MFKKPSLLKNNFSTLPFKINLNSFPGRTISGEMEKYSDKVSLRNDIATLSLS